MANPNQYSWSTQITLNGEPSKPVREDLIALDLYNLHTLPNNQLLFRGVSTQKSAILEQTAIPVLPWLQKFRTIDGHLGEIINHFPELKKNSDDLKNLISAMRRSGLMVSDRDMMNGLAAMGKKHSASTEPETNVCIITCDRPGVLRRLLRSCLEIKHEGLHWTLIDDSRELDNARLNREAAEQCGLNFRYFGRKEQEEFRLKLVKRLPRNKESIEFLLKGDPNEARGTYGRSRNFALLLSPASRLIVMDDDILCTGLKPPFQKEGVQIESTSRQADFFQENGEWEQFFDSSIDPIRAHHEHLGEPLVPTLRKLEGFTAHRDQLLANASIHDILPLNGSSRVVCTLNGTYGDPGTSSIDWIFSLDSESSQRLSNKLSDSNSRIPNRNCWVGRNQHTILSRYALISQITGLDNNMLLPPYYPAGRNEDFLFGEMLQFMHPASVALDLGLATPHLPIPQRHWKADQISKPANPGLNHFLAGTIGDLSVLPVTPADPDTALGTLSIHFKQLSQLNNSTLSSLISDRIASARSGLLETLSKHIHSDLFGESTKEVIKQIMQANANSLSDISESSMTDIHPSIRNRDALPFIRVCCAQFGEALSSWPLIMKEADSITRQ